MNYINEIIRLNLNAIQKVLDVAGYTVDSTRNMVCPRGEKVVAAKYADINKDFSFRSTYRKEKDNMSNSNSSCCEPCCDKIQLIEYTIVDISENGKILACGKKLNTDCIEEADIRTWLITEYIAKQPSTKDVNERILPQTEGLCEHIIGAEYKTKNLRVCYKVLCTWAKPCVDHNQKHIDALDGIKTAIGDIQKSDSQVIIDLLKNNKITYDNKPFAIK